MADNADHRAVERRVVGRANRTSNDCTAVNSGLRCVYVVSDNMVDAAERRAAGNIAHPLSEWVNAGKRAANRHILGSSGLRCVNVTGDVAELYGV